MQRGVSRAFAHRDMREDSEGWPGEGGAKRRCAKFCDAVGIHKEPNTRAHGPMGSPELGTIVDIHKRIIGPGPKGRPHKRKIGNKYLDFLRILFPAEIDFD